MTAGFRTHIVLGVVACIVGCKLGFEQGAAPTARDAEVADAADAPGAADAPDVADAPAAACTLGPWHEPPDGQPFANVNTADIEWAAEISDDGLRVILTSNHGTMRQHLYMTQRASVRVPFDPPVPLAINSDDNTSEDTDPTFSDDELYFASGLRANRCIYVSRRVDTPAVWGPPQRLDGLCAASAGIGGLYITRDGKHLYYDVDDVVLVASRDLSGNFNTPGATVGGLSGGMTYCTLTRDELTIYCEATPAGNRSQVWVATRTSPGMAFGGAGPVPGLDGTNFDFGDPSITPAGDRLLYGTARVGATQDLHLVERECQ